MQQSMRAMRSRGPREVGGAKPRAERQSKKLEGAGKLLRIFIGESDRHGSQPLYTAIVEAARSAGLSGATVFKGIEGFGAHSVVHAARVFDLSTDLPVLIEIVDTEEKIRGFLPTLDGLVKEGLVTLETVEVLRYMSGVPKR